MLESFQRSIDRQVLRDDEPGSEAGAGSEPAESDADQEFERLDGAACLQLCRDASPDSLLPADAGIAMRQQGAVLQATDDSAMSATFVVVTRTKEANRQGNRVHIMPNQYGQGIRVDMGFQAAPVVLYDHGFGGIPFPVGMAEDPAGNLSLKLQKTKATSTVWFRKLPHSEAVYAATSEGLLRMASIGFNPILGMLGAERPKGNTPEGVEYMAVDRWRGLDFVEAELLEWSITPIGADRGAMKQALHRGKIHDVRIPDFLAQSWRHYAGPDRERAWSPGWRPGEGETAQTLDEGVTVVGQSEKVAGFLQRIVQPMHGKPGTELAPKPPEESAVEPSTSDEEAGAETAAAESAVDGATPDGTNTTEQSATLPIEQLAELVRERLNAPRAVPTGLFELIGQRVAQQVNEFGERQAAAVASIEADLDRRLGRIVDEK